MIQALKLLLQPINKRIQMLATRIIVETAKDSEGLQLIKAGLFADELIENLERFQNYGFTSRPKKGAQGVAIFPGGNREDGFIIAIDDRRFRLAGLAEGEVAIYTDEGDQIVFKRGNKIEITSSGEVDVAAPVVTITASQVTIDAVATSINGNVAIDGDVVVTGGVAATGAVVGTGGVSDSVGTISSFRTAYNIHKHIENNIGGGPTGATDTPI